jgi:NADPH-dependent glutamate synthase beta subunit-like oxidoreductase
MDSAKKFAERFNDIEMFRYCEQCGRCSSACPISGINGFNIRRLVRHVELDLIDEIAGSAMPWFCAACGRCEDACPNGIKILDITRNLRAIGPVDLAPGQPQCVAACPAGIDIPGYLRLIAQGRADEACKLIMERAPFPGILGRVCTHPCETACKRGEINAAISICAVKRFAADKAGDLSGWIAQTRPDTGHNVAVIGAGPAGLTAAFYLRKKGHRVTVFEARPKAGGMMRYGIPYYRLPEDILDEEVGQVLGTGIDLRTDTKFGEDVTLAQLKSDGYEAVFISVGAQLSKKIPLEGADLPQVLWGVDFLSAVAEGHNVPVKERVLVVGGGNVAVDVSLTALRLGAGEVSLACLESREQMPANPWEIDQALEEGVRMYFSWGPSKILSHNGVVSGVELVRCTSVFDAAGNFCPFFDDTTRTVEADQVILAIGQACDLCFCDDQGQVRVDKNLIAIDKKTQETALPGVFAGGDAANGPATVVHAIAAGRRAAISIDRYLGGNGIIEVGTRPATSSSAESNSEGGIEGGRANAEGANKKDAYDGKRESGFAELKRAPTPCLPVAERHHGFAEVELCLSDEDVQKEVHRCLQCDLELCLAETLRRQYRDAG